MKTYAQDNEAWKQVNALLPESFQIKADNLPHEEIWEWNGNKMHIDRYSNPESEYRLFLHHGVGTNGRQLMMIFGHKMADLGYEVVAMDNLGYGMTEVTQKNVTYSDWIKAFTDFVNYETKRDYKKPILYGLSAGGMITYHASCFIEEVYGIIGMCFLKNDNKIVGEETSKFKGTSWMVVPAMKKLTQTPLRTLMVPMKSVSKMTALTNNPDALKIMMQDSASGGASVQLQFLSEYMTYQTPIPVTKFDKCPILLTQPELDRWTPLKLSEISMSGIKTSFTIKILTGGGHYPMEKTALQELVDYADKFIKKL
ncbi:MAG: alpha/beta hydrolase [Alloprevotella sp.]|nr:alpha/beta hydrolase [Bacteroidales bacterium]MDY3942616.1 alpha/beta hydrolase [Alloprevotella sp.]